MIEKCIIPELHIVQGFVNHIFWDILIPLLGRENALKWPQKIKVIHKNYHGEIFEGNACRKLLKCADELNDPEIYKNLGSSGNLKILPYINALKAMDKVVNSSFAARRVSPHLDKHIAELEKTYAALEINETLKVHVTIKHLKQSLSFLGNYGLGIWSEQAGESIHRCFLQFWKNYKTNIHDYSDISENNSSEDSEENFGKISEDDVLKESSYISRLRRAVVDFSSSHV